MTEKLLDKRKLTPEQTKMRSLEKDISLLKDRIQKLEESKVSAPKAKEKLSARSMTRTGTNVAVEKPFSFGNSSLMSGSTELAASLGK